ncbi:hypothetical protein DNTS_014141 [Danionella cerebrum]|uniref:Na(+)/H(+) exchange regulatory cofactor NHE-RF1 n=1 Tax=Danionella cerebrum TaxID=2873325 RepID=A0A553MU19_9TELE|nr:hypothetical protein DNTS_014141 [Danionella translucida]
MSSDLRPKLCVLEKGDNGYGFHLHGEKNMPGQFIRHVEPDSPAAVAGLLAGDKLALVNGENVEDEKHQQVVSRIRGITGKLELVVVNPETVELLQKLNLKCLKEYVTEGIPIPTPSAESNEEEEEVKNGTSRGSSPVPETNGDIRLDRLSVISKESKNDLRPRLCHIKKGATGYGFNLHTEKSKPGQYIRAVDEDSPAEKSGLRAQDKIVQVNGVAVHTMQHSEVVASIKAGGDETRLLVVDPEADAFFTSCGVLPAEEHLTGPLPEPAPRDEVEDQSNQPQRWEKKALSPGENEQKKGAHVVFSTFRTNTSASFQPKQAAAAVEEKPKVVTSLSNSSTSSNTSAPEEKAKEPSTGEDSSLSLSLSVSLQQAKERAHQKRSNKRAPAMDWSKRNELFSNL